MMSPTQLGQYFGISITRYRDRDTRGILLASGAGIMMASMDSCHAFGWCCDLDELRSTPWRISLLMTALELNTSVDVIGICGWFSIDDPAPIIEGLKTITKTRVISYFGDRAIGTAMTLQQFIDQCS